MRYIISFFLIICVVCVFLVGCEDNNADDGKQPFQTTVAQDTTGADTTTITPESTTAITTSSVTTEPITTHPVITEPVTTEPVTTEPWVVTEPAGDGWSGFH